MSSIALILAFVTTAALADDRAQLLALHEKVMEGHRKGEVGLILEDELDDYVVAGRGAVSHPSRDERRDRLGPYLRQAKFEVYRDRIEPVVAISRDGTLGWVIVEVEAKGSMPGADGTARPIEFVSAWIELYEKRDGRWLRVGNVSNFRE